MPPDGAFLLAKLDGRPSGCGGFSRFDATTAELRRMYVVPEARGRGLGKALVAWLLEAARVAGYKRIRLETGNRQEEALGLYKAAGFASIPCWGPYASDPKSRCFELDLEQPRPGWVSPRAVMRVRCAGCRRFALQQPGPGSAGAVTPVAAL